MGNPYLLTFGTNPALHTKRVILRFVGNAIFAGISYSCSIMLPSCYVEQKLCSCGFTLGFAIDFILAAAIHAYLWASLTAKEYAEWSGQLTLPLP